MAKLSSDGETHGFDPGFNPSGRDTIVSKLGTGGGGGGGGGGGLHHISMNTKYMTRYGILTVM
jgi:hypothetical protein